MNKTEIDSIIEIFQREGVETTHGLAEENILQVEISTGIKFPMDLRDLLKAVVPIGEHDGDSFPNWNEDPVKIISSSKDLVEEAFRFDIENNNFWSESFGEKPQDLTVALGQALEVIKKSPILIPIFGHRFMSSAPATSGNPIISFIQPSDIVVYGSNLREYFEIEFGNGDLDKINRGNIKQIPFWSEFVE